MAANLVIRDIEAGDETAWRELWRGYLEYYGVTLAPEVTARTWARMQDTGASLAGRAALISGKMVGFALYMHHSSTWVAGDDCYLEDLFISEAARGGGIGRAMIEDLIAIARAKGWQRLYWHTDAGNRRARALYDQFVASDGHIRYRLVL